MAKPNSHLDHCTPVTWRGVTPMKDGWLCMSFTEDARAIRLRLQVADARRFVDAALYYLGKCGDQSLRSSGIPKSPGSPKLGQYVYPLARSSAATCGDVYAPNESPSNTTCHCMSACKAIQKVPRRVSWLYAMGLMVLSFCAGIAAGGLYL